MVPTASTVASVPYCRTSVSSERGAPEAGEVYCSAYARARLPPTVTSIVLSRCRWAISPRPVLYAWTSGRGS